jgi:hypothetical protein
MSLPLTCPVCARPLTWHAIRVDAGVDGERPDEAMQAADCACGLSLTWEGDVVECEQGTFEGFTA